MRPGLEKALSKGKLGEALRFFLDNNWPLNDTGGEPEGNTLLHWVCVHAPYPILQQVLTRLKQENKIDAIINVQNVYGKTPLNHVIELGLHSKVDLLQEFGAISTSPLSYPNITLTDKARNIEALQILQNAFHHFTVTEAIIELHEKGFNFDEPIDHRNNTLLHYLIRNIPTLLLNKSNILNRTNLNTQNIFGETPLITAALCQRPIMCQLLIERGADLSIKDSSGKTCSDYRPEFFVKESTPPPTYFEYLFHQIQASNFSRLGAKQKVDKIFEIFIKVIKEQKLKYNGIVRDEGFYLLDCPIGKRYTVNCFDLAFALGYLIQYFDIQVQTQVYHGYTSIPFDQITSALYGKFVCFDEEHHAKTRNHSNRYGFDKHCVTLCMGTYYDPTFCCFYDNINDILGFDTTVAISMDFTGRKYPFRLLLNSKLQNFFPKSDWTYSNTETEITISHNHEPSKLQIIGKLLDGKITFNAANLSSSVLANAILSWQQSENSISELSYTISSQQAGLENSLSEALQTKFVSPRLKAG